MASAKQSNGSSQNMIITKRFDILGVKVSVVNLQKTISLVDYWITKGQKHYICVSDVHCIIQSQTDPEFRKIQNNSGLTVPNGMPLVWLGKLQHLNSIGCVYGPDLTLSLLQLAEQKGYPVFFFGNTTEVLKKLTDKLKNQFPQLNIAGVVPHPFRPLTKSENQKLISLINKSRSDILFVGTGAPRQELWIGRNWNKLNVPVALGVGATFDFLSGSKKNPPKWLQRIGFGWLFRLLTEPKRLFRRYLIGNSLFLYWIIQMKLGDKAKT